MGLFKKSRKANISVICDKCNAHMMINKKIKTMKKIKVKCNFCKNVIRAEIDPKLFGDFPVEG